MKWFVVALLLTLCSCTAPEAEKSASASRISTRAQLIGGPKALGSIGDYLLENDKIRVIVHGPGDNRGTTMYPGMIIDADLRRPLAGAEGGSDQIGELTPAFLFETFHPTRFEVTKDGSDGGPAIVTVEGVGDDFLGQLSLLSTGLFFPQGLAFRIEYILHPGDAFIETRTTIRNATETVHPFPFLNPPDLRDLGLDIPGLDELELSVPLGMFAIFGAENSVFATGKTGFNVRFAVEDSYAEGEGLPAFPGIVTDFVATRADNVSYAITIPAAASNYVKRYANSYPSQNSSDTSVLIPFLFSSVTAIFHTEAPDVLAAGEEFTYSSYLAIGRGDVASAASVVYDIHGIETGVFAGLVVDRRSKYGVAGAMLIVQDEAGNFVTELDSDASGAFHGRLPIGDYTYQVVAPGRFPTAPRPLAVRSATPQNERIELPSPASIAVAVRDDSGRALPCKLTLVGRHAADHIGDDPRDFLYSIALGERVRHTTFESNRDEFIEAAWYSSDGTFLRDLRPGTYELFVSRGIEYDLHRETITIGEGSLLERAVVLKHTVKTPGYVAADLHLHSKNSVDSQLSLDDRVISAAGEGLEYVAATDHNFVTDYAPFIAKNGLTSWLLSSVGVEVTTFEMGHFNGYPLRLDAGSIRGGDVAWAGETPQSIFDQLRSLGAHSPRETIVQVNHPRWEFLGYFNVFNLSQETGHPEERTGLMSVFAPIGEEYELGNFSLDFDALEILNGKRIDLLHSYRVPETLPPPPIPDDIPPPGTILRNEDGSVAFPGAMEDWFVLLSRGIRFTGVGSSDSHAALGEEPGFPRTYVYVGEDHDGLGEFAERDVVAGLKSGRAVISMGAFVEMYANGHPIGSEHTAADGQVDVTVHVRSPNFAPISNLRIYANGELAVDQRIPSEHQHDYTFATTLRFERDTWLMAEVSGSENLFPVLTPSEFEPLSPDAVIAGLGASFDLSALTPFGNLAPSETAAITPVAITNPLWVDVDGSGAFDPPGAQGAVEFGGPAEFTDNSPEEATDLRAVFDSLEDVLN